MVMRMFRIAMDRLRGRFDLDKTRKQEDKEKLAANIPTHPPKRKRRR